MVRYVHCMLTLLGVFAATYVMADEAPVAPLTVEDIVSEMRANDAKFDNVWLEIDYIRHPAPRKDYSWKFGGRSAGKYQIFVDDDVDKTNLPDDAALAELSLGHTPELYRPIYLREPPAIADEELRWNALIQAKKIRYVFTPANPAPPLPELKPTTLRQEIGIRWPDLVVQSKNVEPADAMVTRQWKSVGQTTTLLERFLDDSGPSRQHVIRHEANPLNAYQESMLWRKFALGVGFGQYIKGVKTVERLGKWKVLYVELQIWPDSTQLAQLTLDENQIVRAATIDLNNTTIELTTAGLYEAGSDVRCAKLGAFNRTYKSGKQASKFEIILRELTLELSQEEFARMANFPTPFEDAGETIERTIGPKVRGEE